MALPYRHAPTEATPEGLFDSFFLGGFECSTHRRRDGRRLDLIAATGHDRAALLDYRAMLEHGIRTVRDGVRWHLIETAPGRYDWSSFLPMLRAAEGFDVSCEPQGAAPARDGVVLATCSAGGVSLNEAMVRSGWAVADPQSAEGYLALQADPEQARRGLWRGTFEPPRQWRLAPAAGDPER